MNGLMRRSSALIAALCLLGCREDRPVPTDPSTPPEPFGTLGVINTTVGGAFDLDRYRVVLDGGAGGFMDANSTLTLLHVAAGEHVVELRGVSSSCAVSGGLSRTVAVQSGVATNVTFAIACSLPADLARVRILMGMLTRSSR